MFKNQSSLIRTLMLMGAVLLSGVLISIAWRHAASNRVLHAQVISKAELVSRLGEKTARVRIGQALDEQASLKLRGVVDLSALLESSGATEPVLRMSTAPGEGRTQVISVDAEFSMKIEDLHGFLIKLRASDPIVRVHRMTIAPKIVEHAGEAIDDQELAAPRAHARHIRLEAQMISSRLVQGDH